MKVQGINSYTYIQNFNRVSVTRPVCFLGKDVFVKKGHKKLSLEEKAKNDFVQKKSAEVIDFNNYKDISFKDINCGISYIKIFGVGLESKISPFIKTLKKTKGLTLKNCPESLLDDYSQNADVYDFPLKFAAICLNTYQKYGKAHIVDDIPDVFKGIEQEKLLAALDKLPYFITDNKNERFVFEIENKIFKVTKLGSGHYGKAFKIQDILEKKPAVVMKIFENPYYVSSHGIFNEIGLNREFKNAGIVDVPEFYMANPIGEYTLKNKCETAKYKGGWMLTEYISNSAINAKHKVGKKLRPYINNLGLEHTDMGQRNIKRGYYVDLGGIHNYGNEMSSFITNMLKGAHKGETVEQMLEELINAKEESKNSHSGKKQKMIFVRNKSTEVAEFDN